MTPQRWAEAGRLLLAARELPREDRSAYLERECRSDPEMKRELESLAASLDGAESFLEPARAHPRQSGPRQAGPYELLGELGHGGMGVVYEAFRRDQGFERRVAIKLVKRGMDTEFILRRFESERRILAGLEHANIARVLDGGSTEDGLPYFVMELIEGTNVLEYCREKRLGAADRLALFRQVCSAVQYAHQRVVIHRDIKPGNILVTAGGIPKLLDFGLAKIVASEEGETIDRTETALRLLTPEYASPEQVRGEELTTASDVYSLGVVLYELLTGERPYQLKTGAPEEIRNAVLTQEPERPSSRTRLHRDLDAIVLTALRKEPARRYASVEQLSEDIRRYLDGQPVKARPDSFGYRAGKFVRRNKLGMAAGALVAASLVAGLAVSLWEMRVARSERNRARAEAVRAEETARFLGSLFQGANPIQARGKTLTARELLDRGAERISRELGGQPEVQASLLVLMADAYDRLSAPREALTLAEHALALRERVLAPASLGVAESLHQVGRLRRRLGQPAQGLPLLERATVLREALLGPNHSDLAATLREQVVALMDIGRTAEARPLLERAIAIQEKAAPGSASLALLYNNLGALLLDSDLPAARRAYERSITVYEKSNEAESWGIAMPIVNLGDLLRQQEELGPAESLYQRVLALDEKLFGPDSSGVAWALSRLGDLERAKGNLGRARELIDRSLEIYAKTMPPGHPDVAAPLTYLGEVFLAEKRPSEARPLFERALRIREETNGPRHPAVAEALVSVASALWASGEWKPAETLLRRALSIQRQALVPGHHVLVPTLTALGSALSKQGRDTEARSLLAEAVEIARSRLPEGHSLRRASEEALRAAGGGGRVRS